MPRFIVEGDLPVRPRMVSLVQEHNGVVVTFDGEDLCKIQDGGTLYLVSGITDPDIKTDPNGRIVTTHL